MTSYGMLHTERYNLTDVKFDVLVADEGHKSKNVETDARKDLASMRVRTHRLLLTGTPL